MQNSLWAWLLKVGVATLMGVTLATFPCTYSPSNSTRKEASVKKIAFLSQTLQKFINSLFIFEKSAFLASGLSWLSLKAFASLRLQRKSHSSPEKCFFYLMKNAFTVFGVSSIRKILFLLFSA